MSIQSCQDESGEMALQQTDVLFETNRALREGS